MKRETLIGGATAILALAFFVLSASEAQAATCTYTNGGGNNVWNNAANWSGCGANVPGVGAGAGDDVVFSNTGNANITINTNVDINHFTVQATYTAIISAGSATLNVSGNWSRLGGTFTAGTSTVILDGTNQTLFGSTRFNNLTKSGSSATLTFEDSVMQTVVDTIILTGVDAGNRLRIRSTVSGVPAYFNAALASHTIQFVDVKDNYMWRGLFVEIDPSGSLNSGNTQMWFTPNLTGTGAIDSTVKIDSSTVNGPVIADGDGFGTSSANLGDLNGDGVVDLAVGATADDAGGTDRGAVHILFLNTAGSVASAVEINDTTTNGPVLANNDFFGTSIANLGDLNGDGVTDLAVGAQGDDTGSANSGAVHILFLNTAGSVASTVKIDDTTANGPVLGTSDSFGGSIANLGDLNGDGVQDLVVGAEQDDAGGTDRGAVHILFMNTDGSVDSTVEINDTTTNGPVLGNSDRFGTSVANLGDLNGDGVQDLVVGARTDDAGGTDRGAVHILFMNTDGSVDSTVEINDTTTNGPVLSDDDWFGSSIANLGDLNGDGVQDLVAGAKQDDAGGTDRGAVHILFMNTDGSVDSTVEINDTTTNGPAIITNGANFGASVTSFLDLDGDGVADLVVGSPVHAFQGSVDILFLTSSGFSISGRLYSNRGTTAVTSADQTIRILVNGISRGSDVTDASGDYLITDVPYALNDALTVFIDDETLNGTIVTIGGTPTALTGMNVYANHVIVRNEGSGSTINANLDTGNNADTDVTALYADGSGSTVTLVSGVDLLVWTGDTYAPGGPVNANGDLVINGTVTAASSDIFLADDWVNAGTFNGGTATVFLVGEGTSVLTGNTTFNNLAVIHTTNNSTNETLTLTAGSTMTITGQLVLNGVDDNDLIVINSSSAGASATFTMSGAGSSFGNLDYVSVRDNTITTVSGSTVSLPVNPNGGVNASNTSGWFPSTSNNITILSGGGGGGVVSTTPTIVIRRPAMGATLKVGETSEVFWTIGGSGINSIELSYSQDGGATRTLIATNVDKVAPYFWAVPATLTGEVLLIADGYDSGKSKLANASGIYTIVAATVATDVADLFADVPIDEEGHRVASGTGHFGLSPITGYAQEISQVRAGWYIRGYSFSTVYFIDAGMVRRPFWDTNSFFTHAPSWNVIVWVSDATLQTLTLGNPVLPKAGSTLVKIQSMPVVYWTQDDVNGQVLLRKVPDEATAARLFGVAWADYVIDVEPTIFARYKIGADIASTEVLNVLGLKTRQELTLLAL